MLREHQPAAPDQLQDDPNQRGCLLTHATSHVSAISASSAIVQPQTPSSSAASSRSLSVDFAARALRLRRLGVSRCWSVDRQSGAAYYLIHVELDRSALAAAGPIAVLPGMGAEVYVRARDRTALEFLVEPLVNATRRSMREH